MSIALPHLFGCLVAASLSSEPGAEHLQTPGNNATTSKAAPLRPVPTPRVQQRRRKPRRVLIAIEGVAMQVPTLRPDVVTLDRRFLGATTTLGGAGLLTRFRPNPWIAIEGGIRTGSVRYRSFADETLQVSQDLVLFEAGVLLYVARGRYAHLGVDAGGGGFYNRLRYVTVDSEGVQSYGSGALRVGLNLEVLLRRIAFVFSLRSYGLIASRYARVSGPLFDGSETTQTPVAHLQTYLVGSFGVGYRF